MGRAHGPLCSGPATCREGGIWLMAATPADELQIAGSGHGFGSISQCTWAASGRGTELGYACSRARVFTVLAIVLIAFAGSSRRSHSTGTPFNVGIQALDSFSC